jgi:hypothetical protein
VAVTATPIYPQSGDTELARLTSSDGTSETANLFAGTTNGKLVKEIRVTANGTVGPRTGSKLLIKVHDGTNSRVLQVVTLPGGINETQAVLAFANLFLPSSSKAIRAQMDETLPSNCNLDIVCMSDIF